MKPLMGISHLLDYIAGKVGLINEQNVANHMGVSTNLVVELTGYACLHFKHAERAGCGDEALLLC
jgi:hypothetical protein